jgi:hypothetical protein
MAAPLWYAGSMKQTDKPIRLEDVDLVPDAMERLEGAIKHAARKPIADPGKGSRQIISTQLRQAYCDFLTQNGLRPGYQVVADREFRDGKWVSVAHYLVNPGENPRKIWPLP